MDTTENIEREGEDTFENENTTREGPGYVVGHGAVEEEAEEEQGELSTAEGNEEDEEGNNVETLHAEEENRSQTNEAEGSRSDGDLSVDDDHADADDEDLSADLSLSDNEPDTANDNRIRTRSDRETRRVNYKDLYNKGA